LWWRLWNLSTPVSTETILAYPAATGFTGPAPRPINGLTRIATTVTNSRGTFTVDMLTLDYTATTLRLTTDTGQLNDCTNGCAAFPLATYVSRRSGAAGLHGTYFCPPDYASCAGQTNSYFYPVYNTAGRVMVNEDRMKYTSQPIVAFDTANRPYYYHSTLRFHSLAEMETQMKIDKTTGSGVLRSAISNGPAMIEAKRNVLNTSQLDSKQATVKSNRGAIGWKGNVIYLINVRGATVIDSAAVAQSLGLDYAMNLDGGGSAALYYQGRYYVGPGRNLPNAIVIAP
ncbi:MAG: phosphodiester glycosidase family protein, partial [Candidatus Kerfeldbacteria bacterium]|nr:phosphodiester glycosidase family protein [Candidatus Kerfeldbacteria bacterium]